MLKELGEFAPQGLIVGLLAWGGLNYVVTSESIAMRVAHADHIPQCEATFKQGIRSDLNARLASMDKTTELERSAPAANAYAEGMKRQYPDHVRLLDMITGGGFSGALAAQQKAADVTRKARARAKQIVREKANAAMAAAPDACSCQARAAYHDGGRGDWTIYSSSLGLIKPDGVANFGALIASKRAVCAGKAHS